MNLGHGFRFNPKTGYLYADKFACELTRQWNNRHESAEDYYNLYHYGLDNVYLSEWAGDDTIIDSRMYSSVLGYLFPQYYVENLGRYGHLTAADGLKIGFLEAGFMNYAIEFLDDSLMRNGYVTLDTQEPDDGWQFMYRETDGYTLPVYFGKLAPLAQRLVRGEDRDGILYGYSWRPEVCWICGWDYADQSEAWFSSEKAFADWLLPYNVDYDAEFIYVTEED